MQTLPKSQLLRFVEQAFQLAQRAVSRYSSKYSKHRYTLHQHIVLLCLKVRKDTTWSIVLFPDHDTLSEAREYLQEADVSLTIQAIHDAKDDGHIQYGLTEPQRDTLVAACEADYFEVPRENSSTDLSDQLGLSHQALSERLRRATSSLVESTLVTGDDEIGEE